jgi:nitrile hydratase
LVEKGLVDPAALDAIIEYYEHKVGPRNGARVVARAWTDPAYKTRLLADATAVIAELGYSGRQGEHMVAVENTVIEPRAVLHEFGVDLSDDVEVRVWDSTAEIRYLVLPQRPTGTEAMTEEQLATLVTRNSMIGTAAVSAP